jgi:hypothetical protein
VSDLAASLTIDLRAVIGIGLLAPMVVERRAAPGMLEAAT